MGVLRAAMAIIGHMSQPSRELSYRTVEDYLRVFVNDLGDEVNYDFVGAFMLFDAIVDNLSRHHLDADIESLNETGHQLTEAQQMFLEKVLRRLGRKQ